MAERIGFEPMVELSSYDGLANRCFKPLSQHSIIWRIGTESNRRHPGLQSTALPLSYLCIILVGAGWIRTSELYDLIYSQAALTTCIHSQTLFSTEHSVGFEPTKTGQRPYSVLGAT